MIYCADTTFLIDLFKGDEGAVNLADKINGFEVITTPINIFEFMMGAYLSNESEIHKKFLQPFISTEIRNLEAEKAAEIQATLFKKGIPIDKEDCLVASSALLEGCSRIITRNKRHFDKIPGIKVISY